MKSKINTLLGTIICFLSINIPIKAHAQSLEWALQMGGSGDESGTAITTDASGNVYLTGTFNDSVDFDPGQGTFYLTNSAVGYSDIFITKTDSTGNLIWAKSIGGIDNDASISIIFNNGYIYITGYFKALVDFDPNTGTNNLTSLGQTDIFLLKLDDSGNLIWVKQIGGTSIDVALSVNCDIVGNVLLAGNFFDIVDFDPGIPTLNLSSNGGSDVFIAKFDSSGNLIWANSAGGPANDTGNGVVTDSAGNIYIAGEFNSTVDFDPGTGVSSLTTIGNMDIFLLKLNSAGVFEWVKQVGGANPESARSLAIDKEYNIIVTGDFKGDVNFDPGISNLIMNGGSNSDIYISKFNAAGNFLWAKKMGGNGYDIPYSISTDFNNNIYTTGIFATTADFDPDAGVYNLSVLGGNDIFISKLTPFGNFVWAKQVGGTNVDILTSSCTDSTGAVYFTGYFTGTCDFDPGSAIYNLTSSGGNDIFLEKLSGSSITDIKSNSSFNKIQVFPNPTNGKLYIASNENLDDAFVIVKNISGQKIKSSKFTSTETYEIDLTNYSKGVYFIEVIPENKSTSRIKIILQ